MKENIFFNDSELMRYIHPDYVMKGGRPSSAAYERNTNRLEEREKYLSVNALSVDSTRTVAKYYKDVFGVNDGPVAVTIHKVKECSDSGQIAGVSIRFDRLTKSWIFEIESGWIPAYKQRPKDESKSHCGIEFAQAFGNDTSMEKRFSRRMASRKKVKKLL
ncbi:MAG: hypothetical protein ACKVP2_03645 [Burkholderiales bacterium]